MPETFFNFPDFSRLLKFPDFYSSIDTLNNHYMPLIEKNIENADRILGNVIETNNSYAIVDSIADSNFFLNGIQNDHSYAMVHSIPSVRTIFSVESNTIQNIGRQTYKLKMLLELITWVV